MLKKGVQSALAALIIIVCYASLYGAGANDYMFPIIGGLIGCASSLIVVLSKYFRGQTGESFQLLVLRATCDFGTGLRMLFFPLFSYQLCGHTVCERSSSSEHNCAWGSFFLEFFIVASEAWFLCNSLDLIYTTTNPFSSFQSRLKGYHIGVWLGAVIVALIPFIINQTDEIYGFWFVSDNVATTTCWLRIQNDDRLGLPIWFFFLVPLMIIYLIGLASLWIAYNRLRSGLTKSFLPRVKLLVSNTTNVFALSMFWLVFLVIYAFAFFYRNFSPMNEDLSNLLYFTFGSKGFSCLVVWIAMSNVNDALDEDHSIDANKSLRAEVLQYATAGIRSSAKAGAEMKPSQSQQVFRPPQNKINVEMLITPLFFLKVMLGHEKSIEEVNAFVNQKTANMTEAESTNLQKRSSMGPIVPDGLNWSSSTVNMTRDSFVPRVAARRSTVDDERFSQRATLQMNSPQGPLLSFGVHDSSRPVSMQSVVSGLPPPDPLTPDAPEHRKIPSSLAKGTIGDENMMPRDTDWGARLTDMVAATEELNLFDVSSIGWWNIWAKLKVYLTSWYLDAAIVEFIEFEPYHFRRVRLAAGVSDDIYIREFATTIKERLTQGGASGAFFFFSKGENFIAKSCTEEEVLTLQKNASAYADYMVSHKKSYISKILGAYKLKIYGNALYFFVMNNLFFNKEGIAMNEKYDIKGSWVSRNAEPPIEGQSATCSFCEQKFIYKKHKKSQSRRDFKTHSVKSQQTNLGIELSPLHSESMNSSIAVNASTSNISSNQQHMEEGLPASALNMIRSDLCPYTVSGQHEPNVILKDNDIKYKIRLAPDIALDVYQQLRSDADFLYGLGIMDYSLLVGVHNTEYTVRDDSHHLGRVQSSSQLSTLHVGSGSGSAPHSPRRGDGDVSDSTLKRDANNSGKYVAVLSPSNSVNLDPSTLELAQKHEVYRVVGPDAYYLGIIDFQQEWNLKKKLERFIKTKFKGADPTGLSSIEPQAYKERFLQKMEDILDFDNVYRGSSASTT